MNKVKFITDSACDLPESDALEYGIKVLPIPITVDGRGYLERVDFSASEFYEVLRKSEGIPTTAHITQVTYLEEYEKAAAQGYNAVIVTTISSTGSAMKDAANLARTMFFDEHPERVQDLEIYVIDSLNYTMSYGYPLMEAVKMVRAGVSAGEVAEYLEDYFTRVEILFTPYTLEYAKKSGRIGVAA
ncbi:MAG: DegV family protein, partial [Acetanaerobacterium sp.]